MDDSYFRPGMRDSRLVDCVVAINPELSDEEDPSLGVTDGGILG